MSEVRESHHAGGPARAAIFAPIGDEGRALLVERRLGEAIRAGLLRDGERLPSESELAQRLGVALVTAREALDALRRQGLVTTVRGRNGGSFVTTPAGADLAGGRLAGMSRLELRDRASHYLVVLSGCAELAAARVDPDEVDYLRGLVPTADKPDEPGVPGAPVDVGAWRRAETEFHLAVAALTRSARLTREVVRLEADFGALMRLPLEDGDHRRGTSHRLSALTDALADGDSTGARTLARAQLDQSLERLADLHASVS